MLLHQLCYSFISNNRPANAGTCNHQCRTAVTVTFKNCCCNDQELLLSSGHQCWGIPFYSYERLALGREQRGFAAMSYSYHRRTKLLLQLLTAFTAQDYVQDKMPTLQNSSMVCSGWMSKCVPLTHAPSKIHANQPLGSLIKHRVA